jgi:hypothetical protein
MAPHCSTCGADTNTLNRGLPVCVERHLQMVGREATSEEQAALDAYLVANVRYIVACRDPSTPIRYGRRDAWNGLDLRKARYMHKYVSDGLAKYRTFGPTGKTGVGMLEAERHVEAMDLCVEAIKSYLEVVKILSTQASESEVREGHTEDAVGG